MKKSDKLKIIKNSNSKAEVLRKLGLKPKGGNYRVLTKFIIKNGIDVSHFGNFFKAYPEDELRELVRENTSYGQIFNKLDIKPSGTNYTSIKKRVFEFGLSIDHFLGRGQKGVSKNIPYKNKLEDILTENSFYQGTKLKKRLIKSKMLVEKCAVCGIKNWRGKKLSLHIDHINGNYTDNKITNLRLLCPNCDSQTDTYCGRNKGKVNLEKQLL